MTPIDPQISDARPSARPGWRLFNPILAGASLRDRLIACLGALIGVCGTAAICGFLFRHDPHLPLIVAPVGASAVLLFAVPASPLAQPWPIIGGNSLSALIGLVVAHLVPEPVLALGLALTLAIAGMSLARCLHPPGGAAALIAAMGGAQVESFGFWFPLAPVALNSVLLVGLGILFHKLTRRAYPHHAVATPPSAHGTRDMPPQRRVSFRPEDVDSALANLHETFDIDRDDLERILREVELRALTRTHGDLLCKDLMSRDVVSVTLDDDPDRARQLLIEHNIRTLPVLDENRVLVGTVGLRELAQATGKVGDHVSPPAVAAPDDPAMGLVRILTDGQKHAVILVDEQRHVLGLITQTDLLAALARHMMTEPAPRVPPAERPRGDGTEFAGRRRRGRTHARAECLSCVPQRLVGVPAGGAGSRHDLGHCTWCRTRT
jgi:CBS domain-containing membrane protein